MPEKKISATLVWLYAFAFAMLAVIYHGYQFNKGDQAEHLPQVYRLFNPELYPGDFFLTLYDQTFTVREYWVWLVYGVSSLFGVEYACFGLHLLSLTAVAFAWIRISAICTGNAYTGILAVPLMLTVCNAITIGGNNLAGAAFIGSIPAEALASLGVSLFFDKKYKTAAVLIGLSTWFQALVGLQWCLLLCGVLLLSHISLKGLKQAFWFFTAYLICAMPMLGPVLLKQFQATAAVDMAEYYRILYIYRNVLHYIPSLFPTTDYLFFIVLCLVATGIGFRYRKEVSGFLFILAALIISGCLLYWFLLEIMGVMAIGKLQWFKTTVWLNAFCCILIGYGLLQIVKKIQEFLDAGWMYYFLPALSFVGLLLVNNASWLPAEKLKHRYQVGNYSRTDLELMHTWISLHTPVQAMVLAPPDDDGFACEAKRPMPVNYKAVVHEPYYMFPWKQAMTDYYGVDFSVLGNQSALKAAVHHYQTAPVYPPGHRVLYRLDDTTVCTFNNQTGNTIHQQGKWRLSAVQ